MTDLFLFMLFIAFGVLCLVVWPVLLHPTLSVRRKIAIAAVAFFILVPLATLLYGWLGVPEMAQYR